MEEKKIYIYTGVCNDIQRVFKLTKAEAKAINWFLENYGDNEQKLLSLDESEIEEVN